MIGEAASNKFANCRSSNRDGPIDVYVGSSKELRCLPQSIDFVLTSPPYCTRIDYAITTQIEMAVLGGTEDALRELRDRSMGTSTIRKTATLGFAKKFGPSCTNFLELVGSHPAKASANYYLKTFLQYFDDLFESLARIDLALKAGGRAVFVVQDSAYKGIRVDLALVVIEMATLLGWNIIERLDFPTTHNMRNINTKSRSYNAEWPASKAC